MGTQTISGTTMNVSGVPTNASVTSTLDGSGNLSITQATTRLVDDVAVQYNNAAKVAVTNFNDVYIHVGANDSASSTINVTYNQAGNIATGAGADNITLSTYSTADTSAPTLGNTVNISAGAGNDTVSLTGNNTSSIFNIDLGTGTNSFTITGKYLSDTITGGSGNDTITINSAYDANIDTYMFGTNSGTDVLNASTHGNERVDLTIGSSATTTHSGTRDWTITNSTTGVTAHVYNLNHDGSLSANDLHFSASSGDITMSDGSTMHFTNLDHIIW